MMKHDSFTLAKKDSKVHNHVRHSLCSADISNLFQKLAIFVISGNEMKACILIQNLSFF